jgi:hypothetical protein
MTVRWLCPVASELINFQLNACFVFPACQQLKWHYVTQLENHFYSPIYSAAADSFKGWPHYRGKN